MAVASTAYATALWWRTRAPLQHLAMFASAAVLTGTGIAQAPWLALGAGPGRVGALCTVGRAVYRGYLVPARSATSPR